MFFQWFEKCGIVGEVNDDPDWDDPDYYSHTPLDYELLLVNYFKEGRTIHAHPGFPPSPLILAIAAANNPPKDPESAAAEKNNAVRRPISSRLYQHDK